MLNLRIHYAPHRGLEALGPHALRRTQGAHGSHGSTAVEERALDVFYMPQKRFWGVAAGGQEVVDSPLYWRGRPPSGNRLLACFSVSDKGLGILNLWLKG